MSPGALTFKAKLSSGDGGGVQSSAGGAGRVRVSARGLGVWWGGSSTAPHRKLGAPA